MIKKVLLITIAATTWAYSQIPYTFTPDSTARASQVNANFTYLLTQINSLKQRCDSIAILRTRCDSIAILKVRCDSLSGATRSLGDSLNTNKTRVNNVRDSLQTLRQQSVLPVGTVVASMLDSVKFAQVAGDGWVLADGRSAGPYVAYFQATSKANLPDLRGIFLRGLNAGRNDGNQDPDGARATGNFQADAMEIHNHQIAGNANPVNKYNGYGENYVAPGGGPSINTSNPTSGRVTSETRPKNVSVYYYIKVK